MKHDEEKEFEQLLADKRHKELVKSLGAIASLLNDKKDVEINDILKGQGENIKALIASIKSIPKPEATIINTDQGDILKSLDKICKDIIESNNKVVETIEKRQLPSSFELIKSYNGSTESVKVKYKPANELTINNIN